MENRELAGNIPLRKYLMRKAARNRTPLSGAFELTPKCNMSCRMCYIRMSGAELRERGREYTAREWIAMGKECVRHGMLLLLLTGGEPFLRPDFREIYTELKKLGLVIQINTNGTLIDEETVEWLTQDPPAKMNITIYGGREETYQRLCGYENGYEAAVKAVDMLCQAGIHVGINASLTRYNIGDLEEIVAFAKARGLKLNVASYMFPPVRNAKKGVTDDEVRFTPEECADARLRSMRLQLSGEEFAMAAKAVCEGNLVIPEEMGDCDRSLSERMGCMAGKSSFWITWDGRMTPCGMMNEPVTRPFEDGFIESWKTIAEKTNQIYMPPECNECEARKLCPVCGALSAAEGHGDSTKRPDYLCQGTKAFVEKLKQASDHVLTDRH